LSGRPPSTATTPPVSARSLSPEAEQVFPASPIKRISSELQAEIDEMLGEFSLDELMDAEGKEKSGDVVTQIELDQRYMARVVKWDRESVFFTIGGQHEAIAARRQFDELPEPGTLFEVVPTRYLSDDNLYEVVVPGSSVDVQDWSDLSEGVLVEAKVTGHNKGGLECEVNRIPGFIPISQVAMYRVEDLEPYLNQTLQCVVTECNPQRRNLVLSHRAMLERERQNARKKLLEELEVGQVREGTISKLMDFGAFVDLGGLDGLIHISQLSWDRVKHPSEVLEEGQRVKVRVEKIDPDTGKVGLSYRDLLEDPWQDAETEFAVGTVVPGAVSKIMEFGAFVKLAPGVEGLVHVSEIAHHRVFKVGSLLKEGDSVNVKILSFDRDAQRISLSIKAAQAPPASAKAAEEESEPELTPTVVKKRNEPLKGGLNRGTGGDQFGLKW
jgi:small subunit ribosomal protein S1